ncbi:MAG: hypothetical protein KJ000_19905 [Pirellulaceae bacterium]|nr:hypothetical protein [Pirellulaceae bacterium]
MQGEYNNFGVHFRYPEDWSIVDEEVSEWPRRVSVQSPHSGFWELQAYPSRFLPDDLTQRTLEAFCEEYDDVESEAVSELIMDHPATGFDLDFFCMDLLVSCQVRSFTLAGQTLLLICQAESQEFETRQEVFEAITRSLFLDID